MLTISQVAKKLNISNRQVYDLVEYGYLNVTKVYRNRNQGMNYLFSESQIESLDLHSYLAEISDRKQKKQTVAGNSAYKKVFRALAYYDRFMDSIADHPDQTILTVCFYLYHLNHYAKTYAEQATSLYSLKHQVLRKIYNEYREKLTISYLIGPDRNRVWLCEDCKEAARTAGLTYTDYIGKEMYCSKCYVATVEHEYYSLVEFSLIIDDFEFVFHAPRSSVQKWIDVRNLPQGIRQSGKYNDRMYMYGRLISRVEEKIFPLPVIVEYLNNFLTGKSTE
jgi:hypothetical protein